MERVRILKSSLECRRDRLDPARPKSRAKVDQDGPEGYIANPYVIGSST